MTKKIKDNKSIKPYIDLIKIGKISFQLIDKIPLIYIFSPNLRSFKEKFFEIEKMSHIFHLPDQFNELFSQNGWICCNSLSQKVLEQSVALGLSGQISEAHQLLIDSVDEKFIDLILLKSRTREHFKLRIPLLNLLKTDYLEQRYHACIPLLLALIDGLANDISKHIGFFAKNSDFELFDSITAHSSGLPFLKKIMNSSRKQTNDEKLTIPYRHGILHGRDLNFDNKEVASKCWWTLAALIDWSDDLTQKKEPEKEKTLFEILENSQANTAYINRMNNWKKRTSRDLNFWKNQTLETLEINSPEYILLLFLDAWKNRQWGKIPPLLQHNIQEHHGKASKEVKNDYSPIRILDYYIQDSIDERSSLTRIKILLKFIKNNTENSTSIDVFLTYSDTTTSQSELRGEPNGKWYIIQSSLSSIIFS